MRFFSCSCPHLFIYLFIPSLIFLCHVMGMDILYRRYLGGGDSGFGFISFMFYTLCLLHISFVVSFGEGVCLYF